MGYVWEGWALVRLFWGLLYRAFSGRTGRVKGLLDLCIVLLNIFRIRRDFSGKKDEKERVARGGTSKIKLWWCWNTSPKSEFTVTRLFSSNASSMASDSRGMSEPDQKYPLGDKNNREHVKMLSFTLTPRCPIGSPSQQP